MAATASSITSPTTFTAVNTAMNFAALAFSLRRYIFSVIRLASEEINVPTPPIFTPTSNAFQLEVNCESKIADGTLLITWQDKAEKSNTFLFNNAENIRDTAGILAIFPAKIKKATNVKSKP